jgi:hypothetical protein
VRSNSSHAKTPQSHSNRFGIGLSESNIRNFETGCIGLFFVNFNEFVLTLPLRPPTPFKMSNIWQIKNDSDTGRLYYFNTVTQMSTWEKPDVLKTPLEVIFLI